MTAVLGSYEAIEELRLAAIELRDAVERSIEALDRSETLLVQTAAMVLSPPVFAPDPVVTLAPTWARPSSAPEEPSRPA